jgi:PII-like signaling protein
MSDTGDWQLLRIFVGESERLRGKPLYEMLVVKASEMQLSGATVLRGICGFRGNAPVHSTRHLIQSTDLPLVVEVADRREKLEAYAAAVRTLVDEAGSDALIIVEDAHAILSKKAGPA